MKLSARKQNYLRLFATAVLLVQLIVFVGVFLRGARDVFMVLGVADWIWVAIFLALGGVLSAITAKTLYLVFRTEWDDKFLKKWNKYKKQYIVTTLVVALMYLVHVELGSVLLYAGASIGSFLATTARNAYLVTFGFVLSKELLVFFAWIFQWYFVNWIVGLVLRLHKKIWKNS